MRTTIIVPIPVAGSQVHLFETAMHRPVITAPRRGIRRKISHATGQRRTGPGPRRWTKATWAQAIPHDVALNLRSSRLPSVKWMLYIPLTTWAAAAGSADAGAASGTANAASATVVTGMLPHRRS